jgi:hypothetical protein
MSLILLIPEIVVTYYTIAVSPRIGINVKVLSSLITFVPLLLWPPIVMLGAALVSLIGGIGYIITETYANGCDGNDKCFLETKIFKYMTEGIIDFWDYNYHTYFNFLKEKRTSNGDVFEIKIIQIVIGSILAAFGMVIDTIFITVILVIKFVPIVLKLMYELTKLWASTGDNGCKDACICFCFPPYLVGMCLIIPLCVIGLPICILVGAIYGGKCAIVAYKNDNILDGIKQIFINIYEVDKASNEAIFENDTSCCFKCFDFTLAGSGIRSSGFSVRNNISFGANRPIAPNVQYNSSPPPAQQVMANVVQHVVPPPQYNNNLNQINPYLQNKPDEIKKITMVEVWNNFFKMCVTFGVDAVNKGLVTSDDIECADPFIFIGLPSLVTLRALNRSYGSSGITMSDGITVDDTNRPKDYVSNGIYTELTNLKTLLEETKLTFDEYCFAEKFLITLGNEELCKNNIEKERLAEIKRMTSEIQSLATNITRMPTFHRLFCDSLKEISTKVKPVAHNIV